VGKETDIAQCALKCCNATIVYVSRLRVNVCISERIPEHNEGITKTAASLAELNATQKLIGRKGTF
jgi:hypothetical protein